MCAYEWEEGWGLHQSEFGAENVALRLSRADTIPGAEPHGSAPVAPIQQSRVEPCARPRCRSRSTGPGLGNPRSDSPFVRRIAVEDYRWRRGAGGCSGAATAAALEHRAVAGDAAAVPQQRRRVAELQLVRGLLQAAGRRASRQRPRQPGVLVLDAQWVGGVVGAQPRRGCWLGRRDTSGVSDGDRSWRRQQQQNQQQHLVRAAWQI